MTEKKYTCINCPVGCELTLTDDGGSPSVAGNACPRGEEYAKSEYADPRRMITTTVRLAGAASAVLPVVSSAPVPKAALRNCLELLYGVEASAPLKAGDVIVKDILGTGADVCAARTVARAPGAVQKVDEDRLAEFIRRVKSECLGAAVLTDEVDRLAYSHGCFPREYKWLLEGPYPHVTPAVVIPLDEEETARVVRAARELEIEIIPYGGGSGIVGGSIPDRGQVMIDTKRLRDFSLNAVNMTARGGAGLTGADFENMLNERGFTSGHYPQSFQSATLGGMVATRAIGTFSTKYGKMDDMVTALNVVVPGGDVVRTHEAPKRSSGPELMQLFLGSEGVYGIVTSVEMKIYPVAEKRIFSTFTFPRTEQGLAAIRQFIQKGLRPAVVRLYDEAEAVHKVSHYGFESGCALLILAFEGAGEMTGLEARLCADVCRANGGREKSPLCSEEWFASRFSTKKMLDYDALRGGTADAIEVAAPWDCIENVWREMRRALEPMCESVDCHFSHVYHNGASVYVIFHARTGGDDFEGDRRYRQCLRTAIQTSVKYGGNVSHHHGVGTAKAEFLPLEHGESGVRVMKEIKDALDPKGLLNKGVLGL